MSERTMAEVFRGYAAKEQGYAAEAESETVRDFYVRAANRWVELAEKAELSIRGVMQGSPFRG